MDAVYSQIPGSPGRTQSSYVRPYRNTLDLRRITASIMQGSGIGPAAFVLTTSDLCALSLLIFLNKIVIL